MRTDSLLKVHFKNDLRGSYLDDRHSPHIKQKIFFKQQDEDK